MTTSTETTSGQETRPLWQHLVGIIDRPVATFEAVTRQPKWFTWALPLAIVLIAFVVVTVLNTPYTSEMSREQLEQQLAEMSPEQAEMVRTQAEFTTSLPFALTVGLITGGIFIILGVLFQAAYFYFGAMILGGNDTNFGSVFTMTNWSRLPMAVGYLVQAGIVIATQKMLQPGLSFVVASGNMMEDVKNPVYALLANVDLFWLWHLVLAVLGLAVVARMNRGKSLILVVIYTLVILAIMVALMVGPSMLFGGLSG